MTDTATIVDWTIVLFLGLLAVGVLECAFALLVGRILAGPRRPLSRDSSFPTHRDLIEPIRRPQEGAEREEELHVN